MVVELLTEGNQQLRNVGVQIAAISASIFGSQPNLLDSFLCHALYSVYDGFRRIGKQFSSCEDCLAICASSEAAGVDGDA